MKKKELTLEQLKKNRNTATIIVALIYLIGFVVAIVVAIIGCFTEIDADILVLFIIMTMFICLVFFMFFVDLYLGGKIQEKEEKLKVIEIKKKAKEGNLKNVIVLKSENMQNEIVSNNIEKILFKEKNQTELIVEIYLKSGFCIPLHIQVEELLSILGPKTKEDILENVIDSITIEDIEKSTMQVHIDTKGYTINEKADDYNLIGWFELKK